MQPALKRRAVVRQRAGAAPADPTGSAVSASGLPATSVPPSCSSDDDSQSAWDRAWAADAEDEAEEAEQDGVGYLWGMNIVTGEVRGDTTGSEASDAEARRRRGLVQFTYGTYEGVELSASEVRKLKAEERASLLASRKLVLVLDLDHTLLNSATLHELSTQQADAVAAAAGVPKWTVPPAPAVSAAAAELVVEGEEDLIEEEEEGGEAGGDGDGAEGGAADGLSCRAHMNGAAADTASGVASAPSAAAASSSAGPSSSDGHAAGAAASVVGAPVGAPGGAVGLHWLPHLGLWTKLRPGLNDFLRATVGQFELYVYTMGARKYAAAVVEVLDPDGNLGLRGKDRVIASEDSTSRRLKGLDVVLGAEETTLIVDDSAAVWPQHAAQLLVPRRYHYFDSSAARDAALGQAPRGLLSLGKDEPADLAARGSQLGSLLAALQRIHTHYFHTVDQGTAGGAPHVRASVAAVRQSVLHGVRLLFTRVMPTGEKRPERHFAWRLATELGASVAVTPDADVTHVVAGARRTDKAQWAARNGRRVVSLDWLMACGYAWSRLDEADFPVTEEAEEAATRARPSDTLPPPAVG